MHSKWIWNTVPYGQSIGNPRAILMYSATVLDNVVTSCLRLVQLIGDLPHITRMPLGGDDEEDQADGVERVFDYSAYQF